MDEQSIIYLKNKYIKLRNNITEIINKLDTAIKYVENVIKEQNESVKINDGLANEKGKTLLINLKNEKNKLQNEVITSINRKIRELDNKLNSTPVSLVAPHGIMQDMK